jgi:Tfp pilus assembly ATPase PilU
MRLGGVLRGVIAQRLVEVPDEDGRRPEVEWVEVTAGLATAIGAGAEALPLRKLVERAVKDGMAEIFPKKAPD